MEIQDYWRVTQIVRDIPDDKGFPTTLVNQLLESLFQITRNASLTIVQMSCIDKVHTGSMGGHGESRNPNIYHKKKDPEQFCGDCKLQTCMIRHTKMAAQIGLDQKITIPFEQLIDL